MAIKRVYSASYPKGTPAKNRFSILDNKLKELKRWVCIQNGRIINPENGKDAYEDQSGTWGTFDNACKYIDKEKDCVLGFQLGQDYRFTAINISDCVNADGEVANDAVKEIFDAWNESYAEVDPSGSGVTFLFSNDENDPPRRSIGDGLVPSGLTVKVSVSDACIPISGQYCICQKDSDTEETVKPDTITITDNRDLLNLIYERILENDPVGCDYSNAIEIDSSLDDVEGLENEKWALSYLLNTNFYFKYLWNQSYPTSNGRLVDEAEILARILKFVTDKEPIAARLFRASPYFRELSGGEAREYRDVGIWPEDIHNIEELDLHNLYCADIEPELCDFASNVMRDRLNKAAKLKRQPDFAQFDNDILSLMDHIYYKFIDLNNDIAYANVFIDWYGERIKYCTEDDCWYVYSNGRWVYENNRDLKNIRKFSAVVAKRLSLIPTWFDRLRDKNEKEKCENLKKVAIKFANVPTFKRILEAARAVNPIDPEEFNNKTDKIKVGNGTVNLRTGYLLKDDPEDLFNTYTDAKYKDLDKEPKQFLKFLDTVFDSDKDLIEYFHRVMGYCITGETREQAFFVFYGEGANGKSTLLNIIQEVMGEYVGNFDSFALALKNDGTGKPNPTILQNRYTRLVLVTEMNRNAELDVSLIKAITGGDKISTRMLYENNAKPFRPKYKMIFTTNHLPNVDWNDYGLKRRYKIIPFKHQIPDEERNPNIENNILNAERNLILNWLIEGAVKYYRFGLGKEPQAVSDEIVKAEKFGNPIKAFTDETVEVTKNKNDTVQAPELYEKYKEWCEENDYYALGKKTFYRKVAETLKIIKHIKSNDPGRDNHFYCLKFKQQS